MKYLVKYGLVAALSMAAVSAYPSIQNAATANTSYDNLCINVVTGILAHPENCYQFIECDKFHAHVHSCPDGHVFLKEAINCVVGDPNRCRDETEFPADTEVTCDTGYTGRMAFPGDCGKYYDCANGSAQPEDCHEGYVFHEKMKVCLPGYEDHGQCVLYSVKDR